MGWMAPLRHLGAKVLFGEKPAVDRGLRRMKRVAVFGNAGGGKSTLARALAELTGATALRRRHDAIQPWGCDSPAT